MERRYFISHASGDKPTAQGLAELLGEEAWIDVRNIEIGSLMLEEISSGIETATDFVLLWSEHSAKSEWVKFELQMAFIRWLEDAAISLRIVRLDETSVPLHLRPFLQERRARTPSEIAAALRKPPDRRPRLRRFINRNEEIGQIEQVLYSDSQGFAWLRGMPGIGKKALAQAAVSRFVADPSRVISLEIRPGTGPTELLLRLEELRGKYPQEPVSREAATKESLEIIREHVATGGFFVFTEVQHWLDEQAVPSPLLDGIIQALSEVGVSQAGNIAILTSTRRPNLPEIEKAQFRVLSIDGLDTDFGVALLASHDAAAESSVLRLAAQQLHGHPLSLVIAAQEDLTSLDWEQRRLGIALDIISEISLKDSTGKLLETLAVLDGPLPGRVLADVLKLDHVEYQESVEEAVSYSLVSEGRQEQLRLHPLIRDFFQRGFSRRETHHKDLVELAEKSNDYFASLAPKSTGFIDALLTTFRLLVLAGRFDDAISLRTDLFGVLFEAAQQLYQEHRYEEALQYFSQVEAADPSEKRAPLFRARCFANLNKPEDARRIVEELRGEFPDDPAILRVRGRIEYILRNWKEAIAWYESALSKSRKRPTDRLLLVDLAQARVRADDWVGARAAIERAFELGVDSPWALSLYSQVLEHDEEYEKARDFIESAVRQDPTKAGYHHRLAMISRALGDRRSALASLRDSLRLDPHYQESLFSVASLLAEIGEHATARDYLSRVRKLPGAPLRVVYNIEAKIALAEGDYVTARRAAAKALDADRSAENVGIAALIEVSALERTILSCEESLPRIVSLCDELATLGDARRAEEYRERSRTACLEKDA